MAAFTVCVVLLLVEGTQALVENRINVVTSVRTKRDRYSTNCGFIGWSSCTRYRTGYYRHHECKQGYRSTDNVGCPWAICDNAINLSGACNINYPTSHIIYSNGQVQYSSGGTCSLPEQCTQCKEGFYASPNRCRMCSAIQNCDLETCTSSANQVCSRCEGVVFEKKGHRAYAVTSNKRACIQACSWRDDSNSCYPGTCTMEYASSCECMLEFSGANCQTIDTTPPIMFNMLKLFGPGLEVKEVPDNPNVGSPQDDSWTNINDSRRIQYKFTAEFVPKARLPDPHEYIEGYAVGIIDGFVMFTIMRNESEIKNTTRPCGGASQLSPHRAVFTCEDDVMAEDILDFPVESGDIMEFRFVTKNGGYVKIRNKEKNILKTSFYSGKTRTNVFRLGIDFIDPHHCSAEINSTCTENMVSVANSSTISPMSVEWKGWVDDVAVDYCKLSLSDLIDKNITDDNSKLNEKSLVLSEDIYVPQMTFDLPLTQAGAYSLVFTAYDKAGNHKSARRVFIYDSTSRVETLPNTDLLVTSAVQEAEYLWQWTVDSVSVNWQLRYINHLHHRNKWLKGVAPVPDVEPDYDDNNFSRGINPIPNIQAIVEYRTTFLVDHRGGDTITSTPPDSDFMSQNLTQHQTVTPDLVDGDTLRFWIKAYDIRREFLEENVTVHIDTTAPIIENLWLTREDRLNISVHNIEDFNEMTFEWVSYDIHSGLETVSWRLFDNFTGEDILHGTDRLSPQGDTQSLGECQQKYSQYVRGANCYCTPGVGCYHRHYQVKPRIIASNLTHGGVFTDLYKGVHDSDYFLEITVMNRAQLYTKLDFQLTIDASPPQPGIVHDGLSEQPEKDFQHSLLLQAHWGGFFDRESGVKFYQYGFADHCLSDDDFGLGLDSYNVNDTFSTHASWTSPGSGKYHITVVAYNRALEPSTPVCSDGVTVDESPPVISKIAVAHSRLVAGTVTTSSGKVWFIDSERRRSEIVGADVSCRSKATMMENAMLEMIPLSIYHNGTLVTHRTSFCESVQAFPRFFFKKFYISREHQLFVNWTGDDSESGVYDYELGLMSDPAAEAAPDILSYTSTHHHPQYQGYHSALSEGQQFYIGIKATNKAGLYKTEVIGPVIVHTSKPGFTGYLDIFLSQNKQYLLADWRNGRFLDTEGQYLRYEVTVGTTPYGSEIQPYHPVQAGDSCILTSPPTCTAVAIRDLHWDLHHNHIYFVSVRVTNIVGLSVVGVSEPYVHDVRLPSHGVVIDVCPKQEQDMFDIPDLESDHQISTNSMKARWYGFDDDVLNVTYKAGIGQEPGHVDIREFEDVGYAQEHEFRELLLQTSQRYFVTVVATSDGGQVTVSSDGVTIIQNNVNIKDTVVYDGLGCEGKDVHAWNPEHYKVTPPNPCDEDTVYQISASMISAHWNITEEYKRQYPDVEWKLERKMPESDDFWHTETDYLHLGTSDHLLATGLSLQSGYTYRVAVKFCAVKVCSKPIYSDGVTILQRPPVARSMNVTYKETETGAEMNVIMSRFYDPDVPLKTEAYEMIDKYEWSVTDKSHDRKLLTKWTPLNSEWQKLKGDQVNIKLRLSHHLDFSKCRRLAIKGYNKLGVYSIASADIRNCSAYDPALIITSLIIDAVGDEHTDGTANPISLELNGGWYVADADYTPYNNILSAVWPTLRHRNYTWAVVSDDKIDPTSHYKRENIMTVSDPCAIPDVVKCGSTDREYINVHMATSLQHGSRYYICIHADARSVSYEKWTEELPEVNACSDGITVDLTPPEGGRVFIGGLSDKRYQVSKTEIEVYWDSFTDVEEEGFSPHPSGISHYEVALGTDAGGSDIMKGSDVGLVNHRTFYGLMLNDGHTIFASVKAIDNVNKSTLVLSNGVLIDSSPPRRTGRQITVFERYLTKTIFEACWDGVLADNESGMKRYEVSVGSRRAYDDLVPFTSMEETCWDIDVTDVAQDGLALYISVKGYNNAGQYTVVTSRPLVIDTTAPSIGHVYDGQQTTVLMGIKDKDFVTEMYDMGAHWEGFTDPHSSISHYLMKVGTCQGCEDLLSEQNRGARTDAVFAHIPFVPGIKYFVEITACNMAGLCSKAASDGVLLDVTPPVAGQVMDGTKDEDIQFQSSRSFLGCKWRGFYDPESGLDHYEWRVGTSPGGDEILTAKSVALEEIAFQTLQSDWQLPVGQRLYITVRAYDKAGMFSEVSSNGFVVDDTPPEIVRVPKHINHLGTLKTAFSSTSLKIGWEFVDNQSSIEKHYLSISSHQLGEFDAYLLRVPGLLQEYTFSKLDLHDGSYYQVKVTACNIAGLCTNSASEEILLDSSPPNAGTFAIKTDHAARLSRHQSGWMTWTDTSLRLAWLGFADLHSNIVNYIVTVGSKEFATDLNKNDEAVVLSHTSSGGDHEDEGTVQTFEVATQDIAPRRSVFVAIWAVNGVGLKSAVLHSELELESGGQLHLVRRCQPYSCDGHCVCAVQDGVCSSDTACSQLSGDVITVTDVTGLSLSTDADEDYSCFDTYMAASWSAVVNGPHHVKYYEISIGHSDADYPEGVFDSVKDRVWFDVGLQTTAVIALPKDKKLITGHEYSFFVRAWHTDQSYSISKSDGVMIEGNYPQATHIHGLSVKEQKIASSDKDLDFQNKTDTIFVSWTGKFLKGNSGILKYKVYISTSAGGHSIHESSDLTTTSYTATGLSLEPNTIYYSSVLVYNKAGLVSWAHSDGVQVDVVPPGVGMVHDGQDIHDVDFQSSSLISASWYGFSDSDSSVVKYHWCVGRFNDITDCSLLDWEDVGLQTYASRVINSVEYGTTVWNKVYAEDAVGHMSAVVVSDGVVIDMSPPEPKDVAYLGENLIENPSFETLGEIDNQTTCSLSQAQSWEVDKDSCAHVIVSSDGNTRHGHARVIVRGTIHQKISNLRPGNKYRVCLHTGYPETIEQDDKFVEGFVAVDEEHFTFSHEPHLCRGICTTGYQTVIMWNTHTYSFIATRKTTSISIGTLSRTMKMAIDHVSVQMIEYVAQGANIETEDHLVFHTLFLSHWSSLHVSWHFNDTQSPIAEYKWAVGMVKGGTQFQEFRSVGKNTQGAIFGLRLIHKSSVHVTVMVTNEAGLTTLSYSNPLVVDMTPPVIHQIQDGLGSDTDIIVPEEMSVNWLVTDEESTIAYCNWAIGSVKGQHDIKGFERVPSGQSFAKYNMHEQMTSSSMKVFSTIHCFNKAGLHSVATSDGVEVVADSEKISVSGFEVLEETSSVFWKRGQCHADPRNIRLKWGNRETDNIQLTRVSLVGEHLHYEDVVPRFFPYSYCSLSGFHMSNSTGYSVNIKPLDYLGQYGEQSSHVLRTPGISPSVKGGMGVRVSKTTKDKITLSWQNLFTSPWNDLVYEVEMGGVLGGADIVDRHQTKADSMDLTLNPVYKPFKDVYVSVTAIDPCGQTSHYSQKMNLSEV